MLNTELESSSRSATTSSASVMLGGFTLRSSGATLHPSFKETIRALAADGNPGANIAALNSFVDDYGTHYVNRMFYGGLFAMTYTMSAKKKAELDTLHIAASITGTYTVMTGIPPVIITASGGFDKKSFSSTSQFASEYGAVAMPAGVGMPVSYAEGSKPGGGKTYTPYIDCVEWTTRIQAAYDDEARQWLTPISYSVLPITALLDQPGLFDEDVRRALPAVKAALEKFISSCAYKHPSAMGIMQDPRTLGACKTTTGKCVKGEGLAACRRLG